jgi:uncharacterized membrane protein YeaQ/YmgE (transglycosylase-associated protein family)
MGILGWIVVGFFSGALAKLAMPGPDPAGLAGTILLSVAAAVIGGFIGAGLTGASWETFDLRSLLPAFDGSILVMLGYRSFAMRWRAE